MKTLYKSLFKTKNMFYIQLLVLTSLLLMLPLFKTGFPQTHDGYQHLVRTAHFFSAFKQLNIFPTWSGNLNFTLGSPVFLFNWLLPYYATTPLTIAGLSIVKATKLIIIVGFTLSQIGLFLWLKNHFKNASAFLASLIYLSSPYQLFNIYQRGAIGETMALAIVPWLFYFSARLNKSPNLKNMTLITLTFSALILAHQPTTVLALPIIAGYLLLLSRKRTTKIPITFIVSISLAFLLTAWFWLPSLTELPFIKYHTNFQQTLSQHFLEADRFGTPQKLTDSIINLSPSLITPFSNPILSTIRVFYTIASTSLSAGISQSLIILAALFLLVNKKHTKSLNYKLLLFFLATSTISLFLTTKSSAFVWNHIPFLTNTLYPWRFFGISSLAIGFLAGFLFENVPHKNLVALSLLGLSLLLLPRHLSLNNYNLHPDQKLFLDQTSTDQTNLYLPRWAPTAKTVIPNSLNSQIQSANIDQIVTTNLINTNTLHRFRIDSETQTQIIFNTFFFPGWVGYIDRQPTPIYPSGNGLIQIEVPSGHSEVEFSFQPTQTRILARSISFITLLSIAVVILLYLLIKPKTRKILILSLVSSSVTIFLAEIITTKIADDPYASKCYKTDKILNHTLVPNKTCLFFGSQNSNPTGKVEFKVNSYGLRGPEIQIPKPENTFRILMLGDSHTEAISVDLKDSFEKQLENMLQTNYPEKTIEVLNSGVSSYSTILEYLFLREKGIKLEPDLIILNFDSSDVHDESKYYHLAQIDSDGKILAVNNIQKNSPLVKKVHFALYNISQLYRNHIQFALERILSYLLSGKNLSSIQQTKNQANLYETDFLIALRENPQPNYDVLWHWPKKSLKLLKTLTEENNLPLIMTIYPYPHQVNGEEWQTRETMGFKLGKTYSTRNLETMETIAQDLDIPIVNMLQAFRASEKFPLFFPTDIHMTPNGNRVFTQELSNHIIQKSKNYNLIQN